MIIYIAYKEKKLIEKYGFDSWENTYTIFGGAFTNPLDAAHFCMKNPRYTYMGWDTDTQEELEVVM